MAQDLAAEREQVVRYLRQMLVGPSSGPAERLAGSPLDRYMLGILYPTEAGFAEATAGEDGAEAAGEEALENPVALAFERLPASMGISFLGRGPLALSIGVHAASYSKVENKGQHWQREVLAEEEAPFPSEVEPPRADRTCETALRLFDGRARLHVLWRKAGSAWLTTVTLINGLEAGKKRLAPENCLFQAGFTVRASSGTIEPYPSSPDRLLDDEEAELELTYSGRLRFAVGHGCAATWNEDGSVRLATAVLPSCEVPALTTDLLPGEGLGSADSNVLRLCWLADKRVPVASLAAALRAFIARYEAWAGLQRAACDRFAGDRLAAGERILGRIDASATRMRKAVELLETNPRVLTVFRLATRVMVMQMVHAGQDYAGTVHPRGTGFVPPDYDSGRVLELAWRPFQLGFHLLVLESLVNPDSADRETVDLIWFPTGGGKTEAYLWAAAFEIFLRRLSLGSMGAGTAVIKRYTLRLLTSQQFQRAAGMICACEQLRRNAGRDGIPDLGKEPIRLGLWAGEDVTPNRFTKAHELYDMMREEENPENPFQLQHCPWCGTLLVPEGREDDPEAYGVRSTDTSFSFFCPGAECPFHRELPVSVIDEDLYAHPPAMLIGTVDKFARLAWDERSGALFGGVTWAPPSLIIQDELHLISGPLGTVAGMYEAGIDAVLKLRNARPKVVAATATIRRAGDQARRLYGRPLSIFPSPGLDAGDSYFSRDQRELRGRLYVGVMAQGHTPVTSLVRTAAALAQAPIDAGPFSAEAADGYWSLVIYHNSRRELGKTMTLARDDIPAWIEAVVARDQKEMRNVGNVEEVSANVSGRRLPEVLRRLAQPRNSAECPDIVPCTNMISVGVDIKRLAVMLVVGQPKATAEYIQATSRIGRDVVPGLVVILYSPTKPRDRSHYEDFVAYHKALYRHVEPGSVTPLALPARERALHAALVIAVRHGAGLAGNAEAMHFEPGDERIRKAVDVLRERLADVEDESSRTASHLNELVEHWASRAAAARRKETGPLLYDGRAGGQFQALLCTFEEPKAQAWRTLNSMRHVDRECRVEVFGSQQAKK